MESVYYVSNSNQDFNQAFDFLRRAEKKDDGKKEKETVKRKHLMGERETETETQKDRQTHPHTLSLYLSNTQNIHAIS